MYLARLGESKLGEIRGYLAKSKAAMGFLSRLKNGEFSIVYSLFKPTKTLFYEAYSKDGCYLSFSIDSGKTIVANPYFPSQGKEEGLSLAYYLALKESKMSEDELADSYGDDASFLKDDASLSYEEAQSLSNAYKELTSFKEELSSLLPSAPRKKPSLLSFSFEKGSFNTVEVRFYLNDNGKRKKLSDPSAILNAYADRKRVSFLSGELDFKTSPRQERFLEKLLGRCLNRNGVEDCLKIKEEDFNPLLALLEGEEISFLGSLLEVPPLEQGGLSRKEGGAYELLPSLPLGGEAYFGSRMVFYVLKKEGKCFLLKFKDKPIESYFKFVLTHPDFPFASLGKELGDSLAPYLEDRKDAEGKDIPSISFYLSWGEKGALVCHSEYYLCDEKADASSYVEASSVKRERRENFLSCLSVLGLKEEGEIKEEEEILNVLSEDLSVLNSHCAFYLDERLSKVHVRPVPKLSFSLKGHGDWFDLSCSSSNYSVEELEQIASAYRKKKRYILVKGDYLNLQSLENTLAGELFLELDSLRENHLPLPLALRLSSFQEEGLALDDDLKELLGEVLDYSKASLKELDPEIEKLLRPYQKGGVQWMRTLAKHHLGGILGDEMGLGKTLQTIAFLSLNKSSLPCLVVAPKSLLYNWKEEFAKFNPKQEVVVLSMGAKQREEAIKGIRKDGKVYVASYDSLRNDISFYKGKKFACLVLDEAQMISNAAAKKSEAVKELQASCRIALTGTPIQNSLLDLWSIFDFLLPGYFPEYSKFRAEYGVGEFVSSQKRKRLEAKITPFLLKRTKEEVCLDLPKKQESNVYLSLGEEQRKTYESFLALARGELRLGDGNRIAILAALTRLRQVCVSPSLFLEGERESVKFDYLMDSLDELLPSGHKALVFSSFTKALEIISGKLKEKGIKHGFLYGASSSEERIAMAKEFNESPEDSVMLVSLKAGGTGLNLIGADTVFLLDPWWNLSAEEQAFARAHRIGQNKNVSIFRLVCGQTVEEKVLALQRKKKELTSILGGVSSSNIGKDDLEFLLS